jgi:hypothetical protein
VISYSTFSCRIYIYNACLGNIMQFDWIVLIMFNEETLHNGTFPRLLGLFIPKNRPPESKSKINILLCSLYGLHSVVYLINKHMGPSKQRKYPQMKTKILSYHYYLLCKVGATCFDFS